MICYEDLIVNFTIINSCSCKCWFCGCVEKHEPASTAKRLTLADFEKTFEKTPPDKKLKQILLSGSCESLMNPECVEIARFLKGRTKHLTLFSNGVLLMPEKSARLIEAGVDEIRVSITGATADVWARYQGCGFGEKAVEVFPRVLDNIKAMCENRDRLNPEFIAGTNYIVREDNQNHLVYYLQTMKDIGVSDVIVQPFVDLSVTEENPPKPFLVERIARRQEKGLPLCASVGSNMQTYLYERPGEIFACCETVNPELSLGSFLEQPIQEILESEKFKKLYDALKYGKGKVPAACYDCLYRAPHNSFFGNKEEML